MRLPHIKIPTHLPRLRVPARNELLGKAHKGIHTAYFALVYIEGHGMYAMAGGSLFVLAVLDFFLHYE